MIQIEKVNLDWKAYSEIDLNAEELELIIGEPNYIEKTRRGECKVWYVNYEDNFYKLVEEGSDIVIYCEWGTYGFDCLFYLNGLGSWKI